MSRNEQPKFIDAADLPLFLAKDQATPRYLQLANQLQSLIESRALRAGIQLPATRVLAQTLGINRNTIVASFERLASLGLIETRGRGGSLVVELPRRISRAMAARPKLRSAARTATESRPIDFRPGAADPSPLPIQIWRRACREAGRHLPGGDYGDPAGEPELRTQIALYLGRTRAMRVEPDQIVITAGAGQAIERIAEAVLHSGDRAALEEPGYPRAAKAFQRLGARLVPTPADEEGIDVEWLLAHKQTPKLVHLTPSHQYPLGGRLSSVRRHALIRWAHRNDVLLIENDYDGEFRYGAAPLPALGALAGFDHIVYVGTFSKVLSPAIRLGFIVARPDLVDTVTEAIARARDSVSVVTQRIVTWLIRSGELERHIRRTRRSYAARRAAILRALAAIPAVESVSGHAAGLHVVVKLRESASHSKLAGSFERHGIVVDRVADFQVRRHTEDRLLMAYGHLTEDAILEGVKRFGAAVRL